MRRLHAHPTPTLAHLLTYCRPHTSRTEGSFVGRYILTQPGAWADPHGNVHVIVGTPDLLWSCHTDTVHKADGRQRVITRGDWISLAPGSTSNCLGADDTAGVYLCLRMIAAGRSGHYIFPRGEERGGIGSSALALHTPELLDGHRFAIALDRAGTTDIVTSQCGQRCASDAFAASLGRALRPTFTRTHAYTPAAGVYTDTHEYRRLIPECTNLSIGYEHAHSSAERVNATHVHQLLAALLALDSADLVCRRSADEPDPEPEPRTATWPVSDWYRTSTRHSGWRGRLTMRLE